MTDEDQGSASTPAIEKQQPKSQAVSTPAQPITPEYVEAKKALEKLEKRELVSLATFSAFSSKMTLGPDPDTARIMADTEKHHESCRLEGYKENLKFQDQDGQRNHVFRMKRLNHETFLLTSVLVGALAGAGVGLYLTVQHQPIGSNILIASVGVIVYIISGKTPFQRKEG
jgi:hypothetical protein